MGKEKGCNMQCFSANINYQYLCVICEEKNIKDAKEEYEDQKNEDEIRFVTKNQHEYNGESSRSAQTRNLKHLEDYRQKKGSWMMDHRKDQHGGVVGPDKGSKDFKMKVVSIDKDPIRRITHEAIRVKDALDGKKVKVTFDQEDITEDEKKKLKNLPEATITLMNSKR